MERSGGRHRGHHPRLPGSRRGEEAGCARAFMRVSPAELAAGSCAAAAAVDGNALFKFSYGLFVLTAKEGAKDNGCIINTASPADRQRPSASPSR